MTMHHPADDILVDFSAGSVSSHLALCVSMHLQFCDVCKEKVTRMQILGGVLLEDLPDAPLQDGLFSTILDRIDLCDGAPKKAEADPLEKLKAFLPQGLVNISWRKQWFKLSEYVLEAPKQGSWRLALQKISAGGVAPFHGHHGREVTVVLEGGFSDESGVYNKGDFIICDGSKQHRPQAFRNEDCICLTYLEAPVRLEGPVGRWIERFRNLFGIRELSVQH